jgi:hypothetical protein
MRTLALIVTLGVAASPAAAQLRLGAYGEYSGLEHKVVAGRGIERSTGTLIGGHVVIRVGSLFELSGGGAQGSLTPDSVITAPADLARLGAVISVLPAPWLALRVGAASHVFTNAFATQRWMTARLGAEARLAFVGGGLTTVLRFDFFPVVDASGLEKPDRAFGAAAGIRWSQGILAAELLYGLERYDFPPEAGVERHEQLAMLVARLGLQLGR